MEHFQLNNKWNMIFNNRGLDISKIKSHSIDKGTISIKFKNGSGYCFVYFDHKNAKVDYNRLKVALEQRIFSIKAY